MNFRVIITDNAKANLRQYYLRAADSAPETAARWLNRFQEVLQSLSSQPQRCALAPENQAVDEEVRQFIFGNRTGTYRALFSIDKDEIRVLHIRRAAMDVATADELYG